MRISVAPVALSPVILSFSIDSQCKKATPEFFEGAQGGGGQKWLEESDYRKFKIFFKLTDTTEGLSDITQMTLWHTK